MAFIDAGKTFDKEENRKKMTKRMKNMANVAYSFRLPEPLYKKARIKLLREGRTFKDLLNELVEGYVNK